MKNILTSISLFLLCISVSLSAPLATIDFARDAEYKSVKLSPDGKHFAAAVPHNGQTMLVIIKRKTMDVINAFRFLKNEHVSEYHWVSNKRIVFKRELKNGSKELPISYGLIYAGNIDGTKKKIIFGYQAGHVQKGTRLHSRNRADRAWGNILHMLPDDPDHIIIEARSWDQRVDSPVRILKLNVQNGKKTPITKTPFGLMQVILNSLGVPVIADGRDTNGEERMFFYQNKKWEEITKDNEITNFEPVAINKNGSKLYLTSHLNGKTQALYEYDMKSKKIDILHNHETSDILKFISAPGHNSPIVGVQVMPGKIENIYIEPADEFAKLHKKLTTAFAHSDIRVTSQTKDRSEVVVLVTSDRNPGDFYIFNDNENSAKYLMSRKRWINPVKMSKRRPIEFTARDGATIYGYITLPKDSDQQVPLVTYVHGGPYGVRDHWWYDSTPQMLSNNGYAVLQVNYRGSGGYGLDYREVAYRKRSSLIQQDIIDGTKWALSLPEIDSQKACIMGWSFGGYSAVMSPLIEPDLFKCSIAAAGVYNALEQEKEADYSKIKSVASHAAEVYGADEDLLKKESPLTYIDKLKIPIFIVHGGEDKRVPPEQSYMLRDALIKRDMPYQWMFKEGEGHGFTNENNRNEFYQRTLSFLDKYLR